MKTRRDDGDRVGPTEWLEAGPRRRFGGLGVRSRLRWLIIAAGCVTVLALTAPWGGGTNGSGSAPPAPTPSSPELTPSAAPSNSSVLPPPITTDTGHRLLGITGAYELYGRASATVVRIQLAQGRVSVTSVPALMSSGPVSFLVRGTTALIRPLDAVPGYQVSDGQGAGELSGPLAAHGPVLPGPGSRQVWVDVPSGEGDTIALINLDGSSAGRRVTLQDRSPQLLRADGDGGLLEIRDGGIWAAGSTGFKKVATGTLLAVGPGHLLTGHCDGRTCRLQLHGSTGLAVDHGSVPDPKTSDGAISPNGKYVALVQRSGATGQSVRILSLAERRYTGPARDLFNGYDSTIVWAPDNRWLFLITGSGTVRALDPVLGHIHNLGVTLPPVEQLAIKPSPGGSSDAGASGPAVNRRRS